MSLNGIPLATTNASGSQVDGHSATIGSTSDASSASSLVGLLKNIKAALAGTLTVSGTVTATPTGTYTVSNAGTFAVQASTELATGLTTFSNTALSSTKTQVKSSAGKLYGWMIHNPSAATTFIQIWDVASGSITVGTTAPTYTIGIPAGATANVFGERGITHSTAINIAATTTTTGNTAPATAAVVSLFYI